MTASGSDTGTAVALIERTATVMSPDWASLDERARSASLFETTDFVTQG